MKSYRVRISPVAATHIEKQTLYIARHSPGNAMRWNSRLHEAINRIGENPVHAIDETATRATRKNVRKTHFEGTYLIYYVVREDEQVIDILDVRHGARKSKFERP